MPPLTAAQLVCLEGVISAPRLGTYLTATHGSLAKAVDLYRWNGEISAAFMVPLHLCEIAIRNGIVGAIEAVYGTQWPWASGFEQALPRPRCGFSPQNELQVTLRKSRSNAQPGHIVADLKFVFWVEMMTSRHDRRLWTPYLRAQFPNLPPALSVAQGRELLYKDLDLVRRFRNRVAHHEPIFRRNLTKDYTRLHQLVAMRNQTAAEWLESFQTIAAVLAQRPNDR